MKTCYSNSIRHFFFQRYLRFTNVTGRGNAHNPICFNWCSINNIGTDQISVAWCCWHGWWLRLLLQAASQLDLARFGSWGVFRLFGINPVVHCGYNVFRKYFPNFFLSRSLVQSRLRSIWHWSIDHLPVNILTNELCIVEYQFLVPCNILFPSRPHICLARQVLVSLVDIMETKWSCSSHTAWFCQHESCCIWSSDLVLMRGPNYSCCDYSWQIG